VAYQKLLDLQLSEKLPLNRQRAAIKADLDALLYLMVQVAAPTNLKRDYLY
jgi:hypothetical protein